MVVDQREQPLKFPLRVIVGFQGQPEQPRLDAWAFTGKPQHDLVRMGYASVVRQGEATEGLAPYRAGLGRERFMLEVQDAARLIAEPQSAAVPLNERELFERTSELASHRPSPL